MADEDKGNYIEVSPGNWIDFGNMPDDQIEKLLTSKRFTPTPTLEDYGRASQRGLMEGVGGGSALVAGIPGLLQKGAGAVSRAVGGPDFPSNLQMPTPGELMKPVEQDIAKVPAPESTEGKILQRGVAAVTDPLNLMAGRGSLPLRAADAFVSGLAGGAGGQLGIPESLATGATSYLTERGLKYGAGAEKRKWAAGLPSPSDIDFAAQQKRTALETQNVPLPMRGSVGLATQLEDDLKTAGILRADYPAIFKQIERLRTPNPDALLINSVRENLMDMLADYPRGWIKTHIQGAVRDIESHLRSASAGMRGGLDRGFLATANDARLNEAATELSTAARGEMERAEQLAAVHRPGVGSDVSDIMKRRMYSLLYSGKVQKTPEEQALLDKMVRSDQPMRDISQMASRAGPRSLARHFLGAVTLHGADIAADLFHRYILRERTRREAETFDQFVRRNAPAARGYPPMPTDPAGPIRSPMATAITRGTLDALKPTQQDDALQ